MRIAYSCAAMERIRARTLDGLVAIPRAGIGIGGILLGEREQDRVLLTGSIEIPCSHTFGPIFSLTREEKAQGTELAAANTPRVIGWYCSKTSGDAALNESDLTLYRELFPEPGSIALVLRANAVEPMRAAFFIRSENKDILKIGECEVVEWSGRRPESTVEPDVDPVSAEVIPVEQKPPPGLAMLSRIVAAEPTLPRRHHAHEQSPGLFGVPGLEPPRARHRRSNWIQVVGPAVAFTVLGAVYVTQDAWLPRPPLALTFSEMEGVLYFQWNPSAMRGVNSAFLYVTDGGELQKLPLDRVQLQSGLFSYTPKAERVTARLETTEASAVATWVAPARTPLPGNIPTRDH